MSQFLRRMLITCMLAFSFSTLAYAAASTSVSLKDFIDPLMPLILSFLSALLTVGTFLLNNYMKQRIGIQLSAEQVDVLRGAVKTAAGAIWAKADAGISQVKIDVGNPVVFEGVQYVKEAVTKAVKDLNVSDDVIEKMILGQLGHMQVSANAASGTTVSVTSDATSTNVNTTSNGGGNINTGGGDSTRAAGGGISPSAAGGRG